MITNHYFSALLRKKTDQHIGNFNIRKCDFSKNICSIGLLIGARGYQGKGYGRESTLAAFNFAFTILGMEVIEFEVAVNNSAAVNMYLALGCIPSKISG
jgi:RimJ/RimL family protein N-acetyltransferase